MLNIIFSFVSSIAAMISAIISAIALVKTLKTQKQIKQAQIKQNTIEAFNILQNNVLDKLVGIERKNAEIIVDSLENEECKAAYCDYKALIAKLEHFAVAIKHNFYDLDVVNELAGEHLIYLYSRVEPIIFEANKRETQIKHYSNFVDLVNKLKKLKEK